MVRCSYLITHRPVLHSLTDRRGVPPACRSRERAKLCGGYRQPAQHDVSGCRVVGCRKGAPRPYGSDTGRRRLGETHNLGAPRPADALSSVTPGAPDPARAGELLPPGRCRSWRMSSRSGRDWIAADGLAPAACPNVRSRAPCHDIVATRRSRRAPPHCACPPDLSATPRLMSEGV